MDGWSALCWSILDSFILQYYLPSLLSQFQSPSGCSVGIEPEQAQRAAVASSSVWSRTSDFASEAQPFKETGLGSLGVH